MRSLLLLCLTVPALAAADHHPGSPSLGDVLANQPAENQQRYEHRHPKETLEFFGIEPGMTVVEALPGGGWYSKILLPYLGAEGKLVAVDYSMDMWPNFDFVTDDFLAERKDWASNWSAEAASWNEDDAEVAAYTFGSMPDAMAGKADAFLFIRALHNLSRFEAEGGYMTQALKDAHMALKDGGILGVVQHEAPADKPGTWADGSRGYLNKASLIKRIEAAGFELVAESDINENPKDQPGENDIVWRLPPSLANSKDNPELRAKMQEIGESNRMTLKFRKV